MPKLRCFLLFWIAWSAARSAAPDALRTAIEALQKGDAAGAEKILRLEIRARPSDPDALGLLAVVLDQEKKYDEAGKCYQHALALRHVSAALLNNYGNHLLATGQKRDARALFLKVVAADPSEQNANEQLARMAVESGTGSEALFYLHKLTPEARGSPEIALLFLRADYLTGRTVEAEAVFAALSSAAEHDARLSFSAGLALAAVGQYEKAETFFSQALTLSPADFEVLYNLGLAASHAGHEQRAYDVLQTALRMRPDDTDVLYNLGAIEIALKRNDDALVWLARAAKRAPDRADIQRLLAQTSFEAGYYGDSAIEWDRYLKLAAQDDNGRRERGFATVLAGQRAKGAVDLEWYVARHPHDPIGHYDLAIAEFFDPTAALPHLDRAITLDPNFVAAHCARAAILDMQDQPQAALADVLVALQHDPENAAVLDQLGRTYLDLNRANEALPVLRKAAELNPEDRRTLMHLARALSATNHADEAREVLARFRGLGSRHTNRVPNPGFVDLLGLSPEQQYERYRARVEKSVAADPNDVGAKLRYLKLLLADETWAQAESLAREILALHPSPAVLVDMGRAFLKAEKYADAKELLRLCPEVRGSRLDFAIAIFHVDGSHAGLEAMDAVLQTERDGDYYLARAQMLDQMGRAAEAIASAEQAIPAAPTRAELYCQVALLLIKNDHVSEAFQLVEEGTRYVPDDPSIPLAKAISLEVAGKTGEAEKVLGQIENRWPEWPDAHLVNGIILQTHRSADDALRELTTAIALGAHEAAAYYYLAEATLQARPDESEAAQTAIQEAATLNSRDPWVHALAGRILYQRGHYGDALKELEDAIRLRPVMVQAHYNLARVYSALGRAQDARNEFEQVRQLRERFPNEADDPDLLHSDLFGVTLPQH